MRKHLSVVIRLFAMLAMALGLATLMSASATAQETETVQCQTIIGGVISQEECEVEVTEGGQCNVTLPDGTVLQNQGCTPEGCPSQIVLANGDIIQFQCSGVTQPTQAPATATHVPATATTVPATTAPGTSVPATDVPATDVPATDVPDEEEPVDNLPDTGQGSSSAQSNSATVLLLGAVGMVLALGAVAMRLRSNH